MRARRRPLALSAYLTHLLGDNAGQQARTWVTRTWAAPDIASFWRFWNPVYGYALNRYAYRPLRGALPRPAALWLTFVACGFVLHDLVGWALIRHAHFPEMTLLFAIFGAAVVSAESVGVELGPVRMAMAAGDQPDLAVTLLRVVALACQPRVAV